MRTNEELESALKSMANHNSTGGETVGEDVNVLTDGIKEHKVMCELLLLATSFIIESLRADVLDDENTRIAAIAYINKSREFFGNREPVSVEPPTFRDRVIIECDELGIKIEALEQFICKDVYEALEDSEKERLSAQVFFMGKYKRMLDERIAAFPNKQ